jgi:hypothetical protein
MSIPGATELADMISKLPTHTILGQPLPVRLIVWRTDSYVWSCLLAWGDSTHDPQELPTVTSSYGERVAREVALDLLRQVDELIDSMQKSHYENTLDQAAFLTRVMGK